MKIYHYATIEGNAEHECGELIAFYITIAGDENARPAITLSEGILTFEVALHSVFANAQVHFKAHGTRVKHCPKCKKLLPKTVAELGEVNR